MLAVGIMVALVSSISSAWAQKSLRLSIAAGSTGGVYYPMSKGMAHIISKYIPYAEATAEVTTASVDNCFLVGKEKADLALVRADTGWDAYQGLARFKEKILLRSLAVLYPNNMQVVTVEGKGIEKVTDLKGKRVSTGAPGSGTEIMASRVLEAYGLDPDKDVKRDRWLPTESAGAIKDGKMDAFFWVGGLPTAAITDLATTPGLKIRLIGHEDAIPKMREKYGPLYVRGVIPARTYPEQDTDVSIAVVWNLLVCNETMKENVAYDLVKTLFDKKQELVSAHRDARYLTLEPQATGGSPIPFHSGAIRYYTERGLKIK